MIKLRVAVPNKGALSESAAAMLAEAGYRSRADAKDLTVLDPSNKVEFFFLRPKDIAIYVGSGRLDIGTITIGAALGYLDFRFPDIAWRTTRPQLAAWQAGFDARPSMAATRPHE